jgi:hypothetical protein
MCIFLGVFIVCLALIADAVIGNYQEKVMKAHHVPNVEMVRKEITLSLYGNIRIKNYFRYFIVLCLVFFLF